jgi:hypothetical protein
MGYTKKQFVQMAFEEIGLSSAVYDLAPEQYQGALRRLDSMMASWNSKGIRVSYPITSTPEDSELDTETNVPDRANEAIYLNLAVRVGAMVGKVIAPELKTNASNAYRDLLRSNINIEEVDLATLPEGAGNKYWRYADEKFINEGRDTQIDIGTDGTLQL